MADVNGNEDGLTSPSVEFYQNYGEKMRAAVPRDPEFVYSWDERSKGAVAKSFTSLPSKSIIDRFLDSQVPPVEVRITDPDTGGQKGSKQARFDLIPVGPLWELAELYGRGAEKYADRNWELGYAWSLSFAALCRHLYLFWQGQDNDEETGKHHLASVVFHAFALMEFSSTHPEKDDRP